MSVIQTAVRRPVTVAMFTVAIILFGLVSLSRLAVTLLPDLSYPTLTVRTEYAGAAPAEIEQLVNRPIEETLGTVRGLSTITSIARAGQSDVVLEFAWGTDMDMAGLEVREKLDMVMLPLDVDKPVILRLNPAMEPIMRLALTLPSSTQATPETLLTLRRFADDELKRSLESTPGVASVRTGGGLEDEVHVWVDQDEMSRLDISMPTLVQRLREENINRAGGRVETERFDFLVRTLNQFQSIDDIAGVFIAERNGRHVHLRDIATVRSGAKDRTSITRVNGQEAIEVTMYKEGDANTVQVAQAVHARLPRIQRQLPDGYQLTMLSDQSTFIANAIAEVRSNALVGGALAMLVIFLFLRRLWPTVVVSVAIPVSIIAAFMLMHATSISVNIMSLGGIALAVGLLVDNAIVVLENIARRKSLGDTTEEAATRGTREVAGAISAATFTTLAVFIPLIFVSGLAGQLFKDQALTVTFALLASLLVALTLIPMLASRSRSVPSASSELNSTAEQLHSTPAKGLRYWLWSAPVHWLTFTLPVALLRALRRIGAAIGWLLQGAISPLLSGFDWAYQRLSQHYGRCLGVALSRPKSVFVVVTGLALVSFALLPRLGTELMPDMAQGEFYLDIELPHGSPIEHTDRVLEQLQSSLQGNTAVARSASLAGVGSLLNPSANQGGDYWGRLHVVMQPDSSQAQQDQVIRQLRSSVAQLPGVTGRIGAPELFAISQPLVVELSGYNLEQLHAASDLLQARLNQLPMLSDVQSSLRRGQPELEIRFDHARLASLGLNAGDIGELLSLQIGGRVASKFNVLDRQIDIRVRLDERQRRSIDDINALLINPGAPIELPLSAVADIRQQTGPAEITRVSQQRVALIRANLASGNLGDATTAVQNTLRDVALPPGIEARVAGQSEAQQSAYRSLMFALGLAVFLVYLVMASQFESLGHPFLIMFTLPLAGAGSIVGLWLTATPLSVVVFIGVIMLAGIVVNNAIVLIDTINQLRHQGIERVAAIQQAAEQRFRPILMTTLTTILGLLPLALSRGDGAEMRVPMAVTVISGLLFATVLTLVYIPVLYRLFDRKRISQTSTGQAQLLAEGEL